jgi:TolB-like protein
VFLLLGVQPGRRAGVAAVTFVFSDFILDVDRRELRRGDEQVALEPQVFDLIVYLVRNRERVVSKDDLIETIWGGRIVSDSAIATRINAARKAIGDDGGSQRLIRTVARRGVRFVGELRHEGVAGTLPFHTPSSEVQLALPEKPSIAVLPFQNLSGESGHDYFVDGMVEEIITALCGIRWLFVIARNSSFLYKNQAVDLKLIGRELGVRYVLEGSVRRSGARVRITAQLVDAITGAHLWADRFDGTLENIFDLQDEVASNVAGVIEPALQAAETARTAGRPTHDLTAYDLDLRAYAMYFTSAARIPEVVLRLLEEAIRRDPSYGPALAWAAVCCFRLVGDLGVGRDTNPQRGTAFAKRALEVGREDPRTMASAALALSFFGENIDAMIALVERALVLNPSFAYGWRVSAALRLWGGQPDLAIEHVETALRLDPRGNVNRSFFILGSALFMRRRLSEAVSKLLIAIQDDPSAAGPYRYLAACYSHMGQWDDARDTIARIKAIPATVTHNFVHLRNAEHRAFLLSGLKLATDQEQ